jgi:hypothetical protein
VFLHPSLSPDAPLSIQHTRQSYAAKDGQCLEGFACDNQLFAPPRLFTSSQGSGTLVATGNSACYIVCILVKTTLEVIVQWRSHSHAHCDDDDEEANMAFVVPSGMHSRRHHHQRHGRAGELDGRRGGATTGTGRGGGPPVSSPRTWTWHGSTPFLCVTTTVVHGRLRDSTMTMMTIILASTSKNLI